MPLRARGLRERTEALVSRADTQAVRTRRKAAAKSARARRRSLARVAGTSVRALIIDDTHATKGPEGWTSPTPRIEAPDRRARFLVVSLLAVLAAVVWVMAIETWAPGWAPQEREGGHGALDPDERPSPGGLPLAPGAASDRRRA